MASSIPRRPLGSTGLEVSILGFGASPLGGVFHAIDESVGVQAVHEAFKQGINFFDSSPYYGATESERVLGLGLKDLPRDKIVVATKVGRYGPEEKDFDFSADRVKRSVAESLARLQIPYIDIIQCHDIEFGDLDQVINETLPALHELKQQGLVRHVGITGLPLGIFKYVLDRVPAGTVDTVLSYCHNSLNDTALSDFMPYLKQKGVGVISASPLSMGLLTPQGPPTWHPAPEEVQAAAKRAAKVAEAAGANIAQLAIQDTLLCEGVATTLVGMSDPETLKRNVDTVLEAVAAGGVPEAHRAALAAVKQELAPVHNVTWPSGRPANSSLPY
ncbi:unnamed protein product [Pedinophyceae sp. YPF-701]|nr:unnamed protein product [Pedinophyceae sp. YPF-701]